MTRHGTPPKVDAAIAAAIAGAETADLESGVATMRVQEQGLARRLNAARRTIRAMEIELRRRADAN